MTEDFTPQELNTVKSNLSLASRLRVVSIELKIIIKTFYESGQIEKAEDLTRAVDTIINVSETIRSDRGEVFP